MSVIEISGNNALRIEVEDNADVIAVQEVVKEVIEVQTGGVQGPAGPAGSGVTVGLLSARPVIGAAGNLYAATDEEELYIWFA